jgi:membrane protein DedA with SNARE-associated domain
LIWLYFSALSGISPLFTNSYTYISSLIGRYGYLAIFILMLLESSSLPVPSEVVLPLAGLLAEKGLLSFPIALAAGFLGSAVGIALDYYIGYYLGKDVVYKHLRLFHISKESLDSFDRWFELNGGIAVFITRVVPIVRTFISFPAGFAKMNQKKFFLYSLSGALIWAIVLMLFGFYLLSANSAVIVLTAMGVFGIALYLLYRFARKGMGK